MNEYEWYDFLIDNGIATPEEVDLVCGVAGYSVVNLSGILYFRTGYNTMEQYLGEDDED